MSLKKESLQELPKDAVVLTEGEALIHQFKLIHEWDKASEVWPLRSGISILAIAASASGIYINSHYRRKLKLLRYGVLSTYLPIVVLPGMIAAAIHKMFITSDILLEKTKCPVCLQARSAAIQVCIGFFYPVILGPIGNFAYATRHGTFRLPDLFQDHFGPARLLFRFARPIGTQLSVILISQAIIGSAFTYVEARSYYTVKERMTEIERQYENDRLNSRFDKLQ